MKKNNPLNLKLLGAIVLSLTCTLSAYAGVGAHGGGAIVCRDPQTGGIVPGSVNVLDLREATQIYGLTVSPDTSAPDKQIQRVMDRLKQLDAYLPENFQNALSVARKGMTITKPGEELPLLEEYSLIPTDNLNLGSNCKLEQLALYEDDLQGDNDILRLSRDLYSRLDNQNLSTLFIHEVIYKLYRLHACDSTYYQFGVCQMDDPNRSVNVRELVSYLIADDFDIARFKLVAKGKLPTLSEILAGSPTPVQLVSGEPVTIVSKCTFGNAENCSLTATEHDLTRVKWWPKNGAMTLSGSGQEFDYAYVDVPQAKETKFVEFYQGSQKLKGPNGVDHFQFDHTFSTRFIMMPIKTN